MADILLSSTVNVDFAYAFALVLVINKFRLHTNSNVFSLYAKVNIQKNRFKIFGESVICAQQTVLSALHWTQIEIYLN